uniref:TLC domain-containing protein n=1 Tax=Scophthalmus maximus TaxID=52904 RepID=A0A8D3C282_SCOMX
MCTAAGVTVMTSCSDVITDSHWLANWFVLFGAPYMAHDIYAMYLSHFHDQRGRGHAGAAPGGHSLRTVRAFLLKEWMLVVHHLALLLVFLRGLGDFFIGCLFTTEFSTPFVSLGKILIQCGTIKCPLPGAQVVVVCNCTTRCRQKITKMTNWGFKKCNGIHGKCSNVIKTQMQWDPNRLKMLKRHNISNV